MNCLIDGFTWFFLGAFFTGFVLLIALLFDFGLDALSFVIHKIEKVIKCRVSR